MTITEMTAFVIRRRSVKGNVDQVLGPVLY